MEAALREAGVGNGEPPLLVLTNAFTYAGSLPVAPVLQGVTQSGSTLSFSWNTVTGQTYQVQYNTDLAGSNWANLGSPVPGTGNPATASDSTTNAQTFYRVLLLP